MKGHDATGRTYSRPRSRRMRHPNSPPQDQPWGWFGLDLLESAAWLACPDVSRRILFVIIAEHLRHAGQDNGRLPVTWRDLRRAGVRQGGIGRGLLDLQALGFVVCTGRGRQTNGREKGAPATWALTWLPIIGDAQATNGWKRFKTIDEAKAALRRISKEDVFPQAPLGENLDSDTVLVPERSAVSAPLRAGSAA